VDPRIYEQNEGYQDTERQNGDRLVAGVNFKLLDKSIKCSFQFDQQSNERESICGGSAHRFISGMSVKRCGPPTVILKKKDLYIVRRLQGTCSLLGCETNLGLEQEDHRNLESRFRVEAGRPSQPKFEAG
jgi:hypothetical protein